MRFVKKLFRLGNGELAKKAQATEKEVRETRDSYNEKMQKITQRSHSHALIMSQWGGVMDLQRGQDE